MLVSHYTVCFENYREYYYNQSEALKAYKYRKSQVKAWLLKSVELYVKEIPTDKTKGRWLLLAAIFNS